MPEIAIEISEKDALSQLTTLSEQADGFASERQGVDGLTLFTVIMTLTPLVINGIVDIVKSQIAAKKHIRVVVNGVEIQGVSEASLMKILETHKK
ncbi:hypothetical protein NNO07_06100 [Pseudomonas resinovorans]|uniref:Uncharacterized protein n=1 Tax=Metapseudomonas resinovorans TaxID=53412 RepID=A0ABT4Y1W4_METRE|nr:hypothetical protein [Pseudomonas resinovorans]MDA8482635.1 hypothetical protein [Pseudomonas resinovorans]